jgi:hypothetical protein
MRGIDGVDALDQPTPPGQMLAQLEEPGVDAVDLRPAPIGDTVLACGAFYVMVEFLVMKALKRRLVAPLKPPKVLVKVSMVAFQMLVMEFVEAKALKRQVRAPERLVEVLMERSEVLVVRFDR